MTTTFDVSLRDMLQRRMPARKWHEYDPDVIPLWIADHDFGLPVEVKQAIIQALDVGDTGYVKNPETLQLMADKATRVNGIPTSVEDVYVTQGIHPVIWLACKFACKPGDEVVVTNPMYYPFFETARATEVRMNYVPLSAQEGYKFDYERFKEAVTPRAKLIFICNPHNPTGRVMTREELKCIADVAVDSKLTLMSDEVWEDIVFDRRKHVSIASLNSEVADRTITAFGFSKTYGVAGLQIGYAIVTNKVMMRKIRGIGIRACDDPVESALKGTGSLGLAAAKVMLSGSVNYYARQLVKYLQEVRDLAYERLSRISLIKLTPVEGTYIMFPDLSAYNMSSRQLTDYLLNQARVAVESGALCGSAGEGHVRISFGTSKEIMNEALNRIELALKSVKNEGL